MKFSSAALSIFVTAVGVSAFSTSQFSSRSAFVTQNKHQHFKANDNGALFMSTVVETEKQAETFEFQAEVGRVMDIIINSLYSNRDVFLRELVSNAADACDKKRFLSITSQVGTDAPSISKPEIRIRGDPEQKTVTIEDSGVGMTKDELMSNLGRIAQSGTKKFLEALGEGSADVNLIGQFGVGFYSGYLVADKVTVITKSMVENSPQWKWESSAGSSYTIQEDTESEPIEGSGTRIILHLKEDAQVYSDPYKLRSLLEHYSEFIEFPIKIWRENTEYKKVPDDEANKDLKEGEEPKMKTVPETTEGYELMNSQKPIWLRPPKEVTEEEYKDFYKAAFRMSYDEPAKWTHFVLEGQVECKSILYIPGMLPFELSRDMFDENSRNVRLYVKRVFINDKFDDLLPRWLKFVRGVVDSNDLPLNVGREILQKTKVLNVINKRLVRKSLDMISEVMNDEDSSKYIQFWNNFGKYLKVGVIEEERYKDDLLPMLRFFSSKSDEEYTSLDQYTERMAEGQKKIYYVAAEGLKNAKMSPIIEKLSKKGYEVLFMTEPLDEICAQNIKKYKDFEVVDAAKEGLQLDEDLEGDEESKKKREALNAQFKSLVEYLQVELADKVKSVVVSDLLSESPAVILQGEYGMSPTMQRYMKTQSVASGNALGGINSMNQAIMEINPTHPIVEQLDAMVKTNKESVETKEFATLLFDVASMTSGYEVEDPGNFAKRVMSLMTLKAEKNGVKEAEVVEKKEVEVLE